MADTNDADSGNQKGSNAPAGTPARSGPSTGAGAVKVGVYEQPARPAQSPLMKWLPILIAIAALSFFAYRYFGARTTANTNDTTNSAPAAANRDSGDTNRMSGNSGGSTMSNGGSGTPSASGASGNGSATANPPGPAGAGAKRP